MNADRCRYKGLYMEREPSPGRSRIMLVRFSPRQGMKLTHPLGVMPPFALKYIQALLEREGSFRVELADCCLQPLPLGTLARKAAAFSPDCLVIQADVLTYRPAREFALLARGLGMESLILTGPGIDPSDAAQVFPLYISGEGEVKTAGIINECARSRDFSCGRLRSRAADCAGKEFLVEDPGSLPFPSYSRREMEGYAGIFPLRFNGRARYGFVLSGRGCPHACGFCSGAIRVSCGSRVRSRSPGSVVDEMMSLCRAGASVISFADDDFSCSESHAAGICEEILRRKFGVRWTAQARLDELSRESVKLMRRSGCILLRLGVESACERVLKGLGKCPDPVEWKRRAGLVSGWLAREGIACDAMFMIGSPGETEAEIGETMALCRSMEPDFIQVHYYAPYSDSRMSAGSSQCRPPHHYAVPERSLSAVGTRSLRRMRAAFYLRLFMDPFFILRHLRRYGVFYLRNPRLLLRLSAMLLSF